MSLILDDPETVVDEREDALETDCAAASAFDHTALYDKDMGAEVVLLKVMSGRLPSRTRLGSRVTFIRDALADVSDLAFVHEQDLLDAGLMPCYVALLKQAMEPYGVSLLPARCNKMTALLRHYGDASRIPLRLVFFNSPLVATFDRIGLTTLGMLLPLTSGQLANLTWRTNKHSCRRRVVFGRMDVFEIEIVLGESGYRPGCCTRAAR